MLRSVKDLKGYAIKATDGDVGRVHDFYFDDEAWAIRYLIVDTGSWLPGRRVLISPIAIGHPDWSARRLPISLTKTQVKDGPDIDTEEPVSRQHEVNYFGYYGYPYYWGGTGVWGMGAYPGYLMTAPAVLPQSQTQAGAEATEHDSADSHLRSIKEVTGYHIQASDGEIGHVEDFLVDDETWAIRYIVVDTSNWWGGNTVLLAPPWIQRVSWSDSKAFVDLTRESVESAPRYESAAHVDRQQEAALYEHYGRRDYWTADAEAPRMR
ncbi:MAG: PRC-barrel domain-containing protein [Vicinamibacterales bacterium]